MVNKILKTILGLMGIFFLVFLLAGIFISSVQYETSVTVNKPLEEVWTKFNDFDQLDQWIHEIKHIKPLKETPDKVGSQYSLTIKNDGGDLIMLETITNYTPMESVSLHYEVGNMLKDDAYTFTDNGHFTIIHGHHTCRGNSYIFRCLFAFFKGMFKKTDQKYMNQFKSWVEEGF